ncbi:hypothetical protein GCM10007939_01930 [Amylibacter marinus]|uniref:Uncharacterized protein n=1 Tax=Amylibacter marinus TaxID=1475483 RepID=A0ABQ5VRH5_9RHOB|nr:hypothetical protein [Amylibacter marinus]GLQ33910.1 hypothetical protein GCM10007939_01930 [Amylibacter marinus]
MNRIYSAILFFLIAPMAQANLSNQEQCDAAEQLDHLDGVSNAQCVCIYQQSDIHMTPEMKQAVQQAQLAGVSPYEGLLQVAPESELLPIMQKFGLAIQAECGISG